MTRWMLRWKTSFLVPSAPSSYTVKPFSAKKFGKISLSLRQLLCRVYILRRWLDTAVNSTRGWFYSKSIWCIFLRFGGCCHSFLFIYLFRIIHFIITITQYIHPSPFAEASFHFFIAFPSEQQTVRIWCVFDSKRFTDFSVMFLIVSYFACIRRSSLFSIRY